MESGLEGPYLFKGEHYFFDRKINGWYSMSSEDYVSEAEAEELSSEDVIQRLFEVIEVP